MTVYEVRNKQGNGFAILYKDYESAVGKLNHLEKKLNKGFEGKKPWVRTSEDTLKLIYCNDEYNIVARVVN